MSGRIRHVLQLVTREILIKTKAVRSDPGGLFHTEADSQIADNTNINELDDGPIM